MWISGLRANPASWVAANVAPGKCEPPADRDSEQLQILRLTTPRLKSTSGAPFAQDDHLRWGQALTPSFPGPQMRGTGGTQPNSEGSNESFVPKHTANAERGERLNVAHPVVANSASSANFASSAYFFSSTSTYSASMTSPSFLASSVCGAPPAASAGPPAAGPSVALAL